MNVILYDYNRFENKCFNFVPRNFGTKLEFQFQKFRNDKIFGIFDINVLQYVVV